MSQNPSRWLQQGGRDPQAEIRARLNKILEQQEIDLAEEQLQGVIKKARETAKRKEQIRKMEGQLKTAQATEKAYPLYAARQTKERGVRSAEMWRQALEELKGRMQPSPEAAMAATPPLGPGAEPPQAEPAPALAPAPAPAPTMKPTVDLNDIEERERELNRILNTYPDLTGEQKKRLYADLDAVGKEKRARVARAASQQFYAEAQARIIPRAEEEAKQAALEKADREKKIAEAELAQAKAVAETPAAKMAEEKQKAAVAAAVAKEAEESAKRMAVFRQKLAEPGIKQARADELNKLMKAEEKEQQARVEQEAVARKAVWEKEFVQEEKQREAVSAAKISDINDELRAIHKIQTELEQEGEALSKPLQTKYDRLKRKRDEERRLAALETKEFTLSDFLKKKEKEYKEDVQKAFEKRVEELKAAPAPGSIEGAARPAATPPVAGKRTPQETQAKLNRISEEKEDPGNFDITDWQNSVGKSPAATQIFWDYIVEGKSFDKPSAEWEQLTPEEEINAILILTILGRIPE